MAKSNKKPKADNKKLPAPKKSAPKKKGGGKVVALEKIKEKKEKKAEITDDVITEPSQTKKRMISKVTVIKGGEYLAIGSQFFESDGSTPEDAKKYIGRPPHKDLMQCMKNLRIHFALNCDQVSIQQKKKISEYNESLIDMFTVTGVNIYDGDKAGYILTGYRNRKRDQKAITMNTPTILKDENEQIAYNYMEDLNTAVGALLNEVIQYETGEKIGAAQQTALNFAEDKTEEEVTEDIDHTELGLLPMAVGQNGDFTAPYTEEGI